MTIFLMVSYINAQGDSTKLKKKIFVGFNMNSLRVFKQYGGNFNIYAFNNLYNEFDLPTIEIEIYSRLYLFKKVYIKPSLNYLRLNYFQNGFVDIYNGPETLFYATLRMKETVNKLKIYVPIGFGLPKKRLSIFIEGGLGFNPFLNIRNELIEFNLKKIKADYWSQEAANFIPSNLRFSKDYGRMFFRCSAGLSIKLFKSFILNSSFSLERSNFRNSLNTYPSKWKFLYLGISFGLMYTIR